MFTSHLCQAGWGRRPEERSRSWARAPEARTGSPDPHALPRVPGQPGWFLAGPPRSAARVPSSPDAGPPPPSRVWRRDPAVGRPRSGSCAAWRRDARRESRLHRLVQRDPDAVCGPPVSGGPEVALHNRSCSAVGFTAEAAGRAAEGGPTLGRSRCQAPRGLRQSGPCGGSWLRPQGPASCSSAGVASVVVSFFLCTHTTTPSTPGPFWYLFHSFPGERPRAQQERGRGAGPRGPGTCTGNRGLLSRGSMHPCCCVRCVHTVSGSSSQDLIGRSSGACDPLQILRTTPAGPRETVGTDGDGPPTECDHMAPLPGSCLSPRVSRVSDPCHAPSRLCKSSRRTAVNL